MTAISPAVALPDQRAARGDDRVVRVASVPADHVYVRHLQPVTPGSFGAGFVAVPGPGPEDRDRFDAWVAAHHGEFDVLHLHFGFEDAAPDDLRCLVDALRRHGKPLVFTAHDLGGPTVGDPTLDNQRLEVLIAAAHEIITLSQGVADTVDRRWGRDALVLPHPHVVPLEEMPRLQALSAESAGRPFVIGVHLEDLPPTMAPLPVLRTLVRSLADLPDAQLRVDLDRGSAADLPELADVVAGSDRVEVCVHEPFTEAGRWEYLAELDVSVLPFTSGVHATWLAACHDVGTRVIAPRGTIEHRGAVASYRWVEDGTEVTLDEESLAAAVREVYDGSIAVAATPTHRVLQRDLVAVAHDRLYRSLLGWPA